MTSYFVGHRIIAGLFYGTLAIWAIGELRQALNRRRDATSQDRGSHYVIVLCAIPGFLLAALARNRAPAFSFPGGPVSVALGLAIIWAGISLRWWSFWTLGRYFTFDVMTSSDQPVITAGPYQFVRHPSYAALLLIVTGVGIMYTNWLSLAALIALPSVGLLYRIRVEESALLSTLGESYRAYAASHKRLIPFVW